MATSVRSQESAKPVPGNIIQTPPPSHLPSYKPNITTKPISYFGTLTIRCIKAIGLISSDDKSIFTKADPYVKLTVGGMEFQTKTNLRGGSDPVCI